MDEGDEGLPEGVQGRQDVDAGTDVIDLAAMRRELEAGRARDEGGGE